MLAAAFIFMLGGEEACYITVIALLIADVILCIGNHYRVCKILIIITLAFITAAVFFFYREKAVTKPSLSLYGKTVSVEGVLCEYPEEKGNGVLLVLENCVINGTKTELKINLYCKNTEDISLGDKVTAERADIFSLPDQNEFYYHTLSGGTWLGVYCEKIVAVERNTKLSLPLTIKELRHNVTQKLKNRLGTENASVAAALLLGDKSMLSEEFLSMLRVSGGSHLFAVSGMHLSLWTALIFYILKKLSKHRAAPYILSSVFVVFYMTATGFSPSVIRAGIMLITVFIGKIIKKESDPLNSLGTAVSLLLILNIYLAGNVSFLLSVFAMAGIISLYPFFYSSSINKPLNPKHRLINAKNTVMLSLYTLLFTAPFSGFFFGGVSLLSPVTSVICSFPVAAVIITAFLSICSGFGFMYKICGLCCSSLRGAIGYLSKYDFCLVPINMTRIYIYYGISITAILIIFLLSKKNRKSRVVLSVLVCSAIMLISEIAVNINTYNNINIYIPDCGNATNICVTSNNSAYNVLIGAGENYDDYSVMLDYMKKNGIFSFDAIIIPRASPAESGMLDYYSDLCKGETYSGGSFLLTLKNGSFSAGLLENDDIKIVFSFYPGGDFENADENLLYGDYLVCRGGIPENLSTNGFENIIVLSDKSPLALGLPEGVKTTGETGSLIIKAKS